MAHKGSGVDAEIDRRARGGGPARDAGDVARDPTALDATAGPQLRAPAGVTHRPAALDATTAGPQLHAREVVALDVTAPGDLQLHAPASDRRATRADGPLAVDATTAGNLQLRSHAGAGSEREASLPGEGDRVGRFVVLSELGRGAMGVVFAAYDEELARRVALKLLHFDPQLDASAGRSQLLREAQALARLTHPNVVAVYEAGVWRGSVYVAMEYVQGVDLQAWLAATTRPWREVLTVLRQAGEGLLAAHRSGLVHRDFKPSNVLVGDDGRARVADFGLAAGRGDAVIAGSTISGPTLLSRTIAGEGALVGTPAYMAPEQIRREEATA
ncbi:MAG TPA: serine/threonine-protein kinase, partial [Nannocystis sp.]